jgi:hypothetical protein
VFRVKARINAERRRLPARSTLAVVYQKGLPSRPVPREVLRIFVSAASLDEVCWLDQRGEIPGGQSRLLLAGLRRRLRPAIVRDAEFQGMSRRQKEIAHQMRALLTISTQVEYRAAAQVDSSRARELQNQASSLFRNPVCVDLLCRGVTDSPL